jgi:hypothetical protein
LAPAPDGTFLATWSASGPGGGIFGQWVSADGNLLGPTFTLETSTGSSAATTIALNGTALVIWREWLEDQQRPVYRGRFLPRHGVQPGELLEIVPPLDGLGQIAAAGDEEGNFLVVGSPTVPPPFPGPPTFGRVWVSVIDAGGRVTGDPVVVSQVDVPSRAVMAGPEVAYLPAGPDREGTFLVVWSTHWPGQEGGVLAGRRVRAQRPASCPGGEPGLCLRDGRFRLEVAWRDRQGNTGTGQGVPTASDESGLFWFFHPDNWELMVKVLNACAFSGHYWLFSAATTNVGYTLTVTDTLSGEVRTYQNPLGVSAPAVTDTTAFATCP